MSRVALAACVLLAGCGRAPPVGSETVSYELSGGFCLLCKQYAFTVKPNGEGSFRGNGFTAVENGRFRATPAQVRAFAERLAAYRPTWSGSRLLSADSRECRPASTDAATIVVRWKGEGGTPARLVLYGGCAGREHAAFAALAAAPDVLPLEPLLGTEGLVRPEPPPPPCAVHPETC